MTSIELDKELWNEDEVPLVESEAVHRKIQGYKVQLKRLCLIIIIQWSIVGTLSIILIALLIGMRRKQYWIPNEIYSPVQDLVRYETRVFNSGFGKHTTEYMGPPSEENNKYWEELYQAGISMIPIDKAAKLPVKTYPIPERPGFYVIGIDVFHQLHCLNQLRLKVWGVDTTHALHEHSTNKGENEDRSKDKDGLQDMDHLDHCIDSIRQSLMCSSDISTIIWAWDFADHVARPHANVTHTCRDFEAIRQWSLEHRAPVWNQSILVPDPLRGQP